MTETERRDLAEALANTRAALLAERVPEGYWVGELSTSALSTATAVMALHLADPDAHGGLIEGGLRWLEANQNEDGGWGDTTVSFSNISTTLLAWSAFGLAAGKGRFRGCQRRAEGWIAGEVGSLAPGAIARSVAARYGKDRTFSVPILMACAYGGRLGEDGWERVMALPFEVAALPREWFGAMRLPVVSYALPALIAIGYARFKHAPPGGPWRALRARAWDKASRVLAEIQPASGGFLEATPLTSFVTMALAGSGQGGHPVVPQAVGFLRASVRADGSWPIDTDLATWGTTLAVKALAAGGAAGRPRLAARDRERLLGWLLDQQYRERHPFTDAAPGGWAWTDLPGGVPDADDTPGALLAIHLLAGDAPAADVVAAAEAGIGWLLGLQNRDGGIPTFCRGWGALPFDRSSPDLTAHTLRAWDAWRGRIDPVLETRAELAERRALAYLRNEQGEDGSWTPLWFGNQHLREENNKTYGTASVVRALRELPEVGGDWLERGVLWLAAAQNIDGGWGGGASGASPSSIEETALAVSALAGLDGAAGEAAERGARWLVKATRKGREFPPSPIGFYFAKLWYHERLYPLVWTAEALGRVQEAPR